MSTNNLHDKNYHLVSSGNPEQITYKDLLKVTGKKNRFGKLTRRDNRLASDSAIKKIVESDKFCTSGNLEIKAAILYKYYNLQKKENEKLIAQLNEKSINNLTRVEKIKGVFASTKTKKARYAEAQKRLPMLVNDSEYNIKKATLVNQLKQIEKSVEEKKLYIKSELKKLNPENTNELNVKQSNDILNRISLDHLENYNKAKDFINRICSLNHEYLLLAQGTSYALEYAFESLKKYTTSDKFLNANDVVILLKHSVINESNNVINDDLITLGKDIISFLEMNFIKTETADVHEFSKESIALEDVNKLHKELTESIDILKNWEVTIGNFTFSNMLTALDSYSQSKDLSTGINVERSSVSGSTMFEISLEEFFKMTHKEIATLVESLKTLPPDSKVRVAAERIQNFIKKIEGK